MKSDVTTNANPDVDFYFTKSETWQKELKKLRAILLKCQLKEELKWGVPCYTLEKSNIVLIHVFKEYCALLFFKGVLLQDSAGILVQQTKNVRAGRQIRFASSRDVDERESLIKKYIQEAIELEKSGLKVEFKKTTEFVVPEEFQRKLNEMPKLTAAFNLLTPGRQRAYLLHFSSPKQAKTRESRIEKCLQQILNGKGLND